MPKRISCDLQDYFEVACLFHYKVRLTFKDQTILEGVAQDIILDAQKREYLLLETKTGKQQAELIELDKMQVLSDNARFSEVSCINQ